MPYRIHPSQKHGLALKLADLLRFIPEEELGGLIENARQLHRYVEFGHAGLARNCQPDDPYWFERHLIERATSLLAEGKPRNAWMECLMESNHGHSGFVDQARRVYMRPNGDIECQISEDLRQMIINIAEGLIASDPPSLEKGHISNGWMSMIGLKECVFLLGADVPKYLVADLKRLMVAYKTDDPDNPECSILEREIIGRFDG